MTQPETRRPDEVTPVESVSAERTAHIKRQLEQQRARIHRSAHGGYLERSTSWFSRVLLLIVVAVLAALVAIWLVVS